jgi:hypothetical protein
VNTLITKFVRRIPNLDGFRGSRNNPATMCVKVMLFEYLGMHHNIRFADRASFMVVGLISCRTLPRGFGVLPVRSILVRNGSENGHEIDTC